ncbi:hypothetical protein EUX98_g8098 [Antrodiella citrinella]|uniref:Cyclase n=1 Tax=Antrodiella citrinella TaxID=2447956 RepID=A0A4S4MEJ1_9APHY|nr:hypothetical protein EUX98_g8098 [Antrodiella citrinella]
MGSHLGTHLDAPYRFHRDGQPAGALPLPLSTFVGPAIVVNVTNKAPHTRIMWKDVSSYEQRFRDGAKRKAIVLIRTGWSEYWDTQKYFDHPFLDTEVAQRILATGITVIGIDALSPDESVSPEREGSQWSQRDYGVHRTVLGSGHVIAENLTNLDAIQEGEWSVSLVPFKLTGGDGSPIRAFAGRREENNWR